MSIQLVLASLLAALEGYLCGNVVFGILISKLFFHDDVRTHGSGSAGMTNMLRTYGKVAGAATAIGDVAKGAAAVLIGEWVFDLLAPGWDPACGAYLAAIFAAIGHTKPIWFHFKGGKGVLVCGGAILALQPLVFLALLVIFLIEFAFTRIVSLGSIIIAAVYPVLTICYWVWRGANAPTVIYIAVCSVIMAAMVIYMHRSNIQRLREGTEYRFGEKK